MNILTEVLSLLKRKKLIDNAKPDDVLIIGIHEEPEMEGTASPIPYKSVKLIKIKDLAVGGTAYNFENIANDLEDPDNAGLFYSQSTTGERTARFRCLKGLGNNILVEVNDKQIEISTSAEVNAADNVELGVDDPQDALGFYKEKEGETLIFKRLAALDDSIILEEDENGNIIGIRVNSDVISPVFTQDITVALSNGKTLGKYENGDIIPATGKTFQEVMFDIAQETINPTFINPSFSVSASPNTTYEVGTAYSGTLTGNFNRGSIKGDIVNGVWDANATQDFRAGASTGYTLDGTSQAGNSLAVSRTLIQGNNNFAGSVNYGIGPQPLNSAGANFDSPYPAGTLNASTNIVARYRQWYGPAATSPATSADVRALPSTNFENVNSFTLQTGTTANYMCIAIPANKNLVSVVDATNANADVTAGYTLVNGAFQVEDAGGNLINYKLYVLFVAVPYGVSANHVVTLS